jgi:hypothetical protein
MWRILGRLLGRSRKPQPTPSPKPSDPKSTALVLKTEKAHGFTAAELAEMFDCTDYQEVKGISTSGGSTWRSGPRYFPLTHKQWRTSTIIVGAPDVVHRDENHYWTLFADQLTEITGRVPACIYGNLIFLAPADNADEAEAP